MAFSSLITVFFTIVILSLTLYFLSIIFIGELYFRVPRRRKYRVDPAELGATRITLVDKKGNNIVGWYLTKQKKNLVIVVHGHFDNSGMMFDTYGPIFSNLNWDVLAIDLRNHGLSDTDFPLTYGVRESIDVNLAINWAHQIHNWNNIVVFGTSMGSIAALLAVNASKRKIDGLILDSSFVSVDKTLRLNLKKHNLPAALYYYPIQRYLEIKYRQQNYSFSYFPNIKKEMTEVAKKSSVLVARGENDKEVPFEDFELMKSIIPDQTHILIPHATHSGLHSSKVFRTKLSSWLKSL